MAQVCRPQRQRTLQQNRLQSSMIEIVEHQDRLLERILSKGNKKTQQLPQRPAQSRTIRKH